MTVASNKAMGISNRAPGGSLSQNRRKHRAGGDGWYPSGDKLGSISASRDTSADQLGHSTQKPWLRAERRGEIRLFSARDPAYIKLLH